MIMQNWELFAKGDTSKTAGFIVRRYWDATYYVPVDQLWVSNNTCMFRDSFYSEEEEYHKDKTFFWGRFREETQFRDIKDIRIEEVQDIPEWVNKTRDDVLLDIEKYKQELKEKRWRNRLFKFLTRR